MMVVIPAAIAEVTARLAPSGPSSVADDTHAAGTDGSAARTPVVTIPAETMIATAQIATRAARRAQRCVKPETMWGKLHCTIEFVTHVLGIDAGGTKTVCLLADDRGRVLSEARGSGANLATSGEVEVERVLRDVVTQALGDRNVHLDAVCLGIAGVDRPRDAAVANAIMGRIGASTRTIVVNDALVALVAGAGDEPGVVVVAGTGSIAYGRDAAGRAARAGGWGYLLGDEGGGFWIGRAALSAVVRQFDGRGPSTLLTELVLAEMRLSSPTEVIDAVYDHGLPRRSIAGIASVVQRAVDAGDAVASDILDRAAAELAAAAASVINRLNMRGDEFRIVLAGGIFNGIPALVPNVSGRLPEIAPRSHVKLLDVEPAMGAVRLALAATRGEVAVPVYA
jgi:N-acetylglucosamine kinase-like BadF-type ATPase